ncbi:MAG: VCBS repeat-containing protein [Planctomycetia bacterium]|nr:VCBS repeat-containing protein [Planctomycetia bacterium]
MRVAQLANGHLENVDLAQADALYTQIVEQLPDEPLGVRNQAICRYLLFEQQKIEAAAVQSALATLQTIEPNEASTYWLLGKAAAKAGVAEAATAVKHFQRAAELSPESAVYWYEAYDAARVLPDGEAQAKQFLGEAYRLAPNNLFLLGDWLLAQAQAEDPTIADTLDAAQATFAPLRDTVLKRHGAIADVSKLLDAASEALAKDDWSGVVRHARICLNVTRPNDFTQGDKRALAPHALEFIVQEFSDDFKAQLPPATASNPLIDISFVQPQPTGVIGDIRDALLIDFDLDTTLELVVLEANKLAVYRRSDSGTWEELTSIELAVEYSGLLAADLDRDRDHEVNQPAAEATTTASTSCFDADTDIVLFGKSGVLLLRNVRADDGLRSLSIVNQEGALDSIQDVVTAILVDFDHDSNLDIVCSTSSGLVALLGQGEMLFEDVSRFSSFPTLDTSTPISCLVAVDWDRDVDIDIVAVAASQSLGYLENLRHGNFRWQCRTSLEPRPTASSPRTSTTMATRMRLLGRRIPSRCFAPRATEALRNHWPSPTCRRTFFAVTSAMLITTAILISRLSEPARYRCSATRAATKTIGCRFERWGKSTTQAKRTTTESAA